VSRETTLLLPSDSSPELLALQPGDQVGEADLPILHALGVSGELRVTRAAEQVDGVHVRMGVREESWAPSLAVPHTLTCPSGLSAVQHTETVAVPGAAVGMAVRVELRAAPSGTLASALGGPPFGWVSAPDAVTVALWVMPLASAAGLDIAIYCTPSPVAP
jgi:hypothetical protein